MRVEENAPDEDGNVPALVDAARRGDELAWETLYRRLYPRLRSYLGRRVGYEHCEDAVNETMTRAVAGISRFELGEVGFDGWVFGIARRVAADHHRSAGRSRRQGEAAQRSADHILSGEVPEEALVISEDHAHVRQSFSKLHPNEQELLELRVVAQLSVEDVAALLGKRPGAVRTAQSRALAHLRRLMTGEMINAT